MIEAPHARGRQPVAFVDDASTPARGSSDEATSATCFAATWLRVCGASAW